MIYLVTSNQRLFKSELYELISKEEALKMILSWDVVQFDTETTGRDPHICRLLCSQFGNKKADTQIVVDNETIHITYFKEVFETKLIIGHNLKFDDQFLFKFGIIPKKQYDTMIVEQFLHLGYNNKFFHYALKDVALRYLGIDIDKTTRGEIIWRGLDDKVVLYAAGDVQYLEDIREKQLIYVEERHGRLGMDLENAFVVVIAYLEWCGIHLDVDRWKAKMSKDQAALNEATEELNKWVVDYYLKHNDQLEKYIKIKEDNHGYVETFPIPEHSIVLGPVEKREGDFGVIEYWQKFKVSSPWKDWISQNLQGDLFSGFDTAPKCTINWASSKQLIPFFQYLGFKTTVEDRKKGELKESITEKVIKSQKGIQDDFLKLYLGKGEEGKEGYFPGYTGSAKVCSTYGDNYLDAINPKTGRIHTTFWQMGAASGRMSCGSKNPNNDLAKLKGISPSRCKYVQNGPI